MTSRELVTPRVVATFSGSIATATTLNLTSDQKLAVGANYQPGDRLVLVIRATTAGTTDSTSFSVQDAPDNAGSIGVHAALGFTHTGLLKASGWKFDRWLDVVLMQRSLGQGSDTPGTD